MTAKVMTFPLRLPLSLKAAVERMAAAEKLSAIRTAEAFFVARKGHEDMDAAIRCLSRPGGEPTRSGDERPGEIASSGADGVAVQGRE